MTIEDEIAQAMRRIDADFPAAFGSMCTSTVTNQPTTLTRETLKAALDAIGPEPIGEWMREQGCPPDAGWKCVMPKTMQSELRAWPDYVLFSTLLRMPVFCKVPF